MKYYQALKNYLTNNPLVKKSLRGEPLESISPFTLPANYNDVKFDGDRYVGSIRTTTVGEYKEACAKFYDCV